jgi:hypothetical protein
MRLYQKKERKRKRDDKKEKKKRKMRIKIAHVLTKIFQVPTKREIYFKEHSRIRLATIYPSYVPHTCTS